MTRHEMRLDAHNCSRCAENGRRLHEHAVIQAEMGFPGSAADHQRGSRFWYEGAMDYRLRLLAAEAALRAAVPLTADYA